MVLAVVVVLCSVMIEIVVFMGKMVAFVVGPNTAEELPMHVMMMMLYEGETRRRMI
ncbi:hypothetical protein [Methylobacterium sp. Leaf118]|uniref:hypothetical protein n=1 Tax=Methylobacterium sp. Leaf118 TaxID=2876562 RepID=UPI001E2CC64D|nr:hypothetical protein [Methylobacterium sp. Leaf118]